MKLFNFFKKSKPAVEPVKQTVGCIAQSIINDLEPRNVEDWQFDDITAFFYSVKNRRRNYILNIGLRGNSGYIASLEGIETLEFNKTEINAINDAAMKMYHFLKEERDNFKKQQDLKKLTKMFPECVRQVSPITEITFTVRPDIDEMNSYFK
jgi:hypothetical protein